ncbi:MAG: hypothetical protein N3A72_06025 [bacterium]|nr:hypothetical protein [bacterium]
MNAHINLWLKTYRIEFILFFLLWFTYGYFIHQNPGWNVTTRMDFIYAVVDQGTLSIDAYYHQPSKEYYTGDVAEYNGQHYSDKAPGLALLGIPVYAGFINLADIIGWHPSPLISRYIVTLFTVGLLSATLGVILYRFLAVFDANNQNRVMVVCAYAFGTIAFPYSTLFFSHIPAAVFCFLGFYLIFTKIRYQPVEVRNQMGEARKQQNRTTSYWLLASGFFAGYALITEYPVGLIVFGLVVYLYLQRKKIHDVILFLVPIFICLLIPAMINYLQFGTPFALGYQYEKLDEFRTGMSRGLFGITVPSLKTLYGITVHPFRGLFFWSPVLILSLFGFYHFYREKKFRNEFWLFLVIVVVFFLFNISYFAWWGGWATGPRHIIPILPFLSIPMIYLFSRLKKLSLGLSLISIGLMIIATAADPQVPQSYLYPLWEFALPRLMYGIVTLNLGSLLFGLQGLTSLIPLLSLLILGIGLLVRVSQQASKTT